MTTNKCEKCPKRNQEVKLRQSDQFLCNSCDSNRLKLLAQSHNSQSSSGLSKYVASLLTPKKQVPRSHSAEVVNVNHCSFSTCQITDPQPQCSCSLCSNSFHCACIGLKKPPAKSTKWTCADCKSSLNATLKKLNNSISSLQSSVSELKTDYDKLKKENTDLKISVSTLRNEQKVYKQFHEPLLKEQQVLKRSYEALANENKAFRTELDKLKSCKLSEESDPRSVLIIGDSMVRDLHDKFENACVKSISGGTTSDVFKELNKRGDLSSFKDIIIHAGTNDISKNISLDESVASMEAAITLIMLKSPTASIHISSVCPRIKDSVQHKIDTLNHALQELAKRLDCSFVDSGLDMTFRNGRVDSTQFRDGLHLNDRGITTLSNVLANASGLTVSSVSSSSSSTSSSSSSSSSSPSSSSSISSWRVATNKKSKSRHRHRSNSKNRAGDKTMNTRDHVRHSSHELRHHIRDSGYRQHGHDRDHVNSRSFTNDRRDARMDHDDRPTFYSGCFNCGLSNHNQRTCHYQERLKCHKCNKVGHKANYCSDKYY